MSGPDPFDFRQFTAGQPTNATPGPTFGRPDPTVAVPGPGFDETTLWGPAAPTTPTAVGHPPLRWLVVAVVLAAIAAVAAGLLGGMVPVAFASWAVAGPVAIGLLALFAVQDTRQRARPLYTSPSWAPVLYWAVIVVAGIGVLISALRIADWAGRL